MCQVFISADPHLYESRVRSVRLHGLATSIRLENLFWNVLDEIARRDRLSVPGLCTKLYDELIEARGEVIERDRQLAQLVTARESDAGIELGVLESPRAIDQLPDRLAEMRGQ